MIGSLSPSWFYGYDVAFELCFAVIALIIALYAFKIYRMTNQKQVRIFGFAFLLISISYFIQSVFNFLIISRTDQLICNALQLPYVNLFSSYGIFIHMTFMIFGLTLLTYMTFRIDKIVIMWLMLAISFIAIFSSSSPLDSFFLISTILLGIVLWHFINNYRQTRQMTTLLVVLAFVFLFFGSFHFMLSVDHELYYVIGHFSELVAYSLILANFYLVLKHGKKT